MKAFYDTNMKKTSIKYRLSNIKSFLYPVGEKALLFLLKITYSVAPKQDERSSAVSRQKSVELFPIQERIPLHGDPLCLLSSVGDTCSPKPTVNSPRGRRPEPLKQIKNNFTNFRHSEGHWIVSEFPGLCSSPLPSESRPGPDRWEGSPWPPSSTAYGAAQK